MLLPAIRKNSTAGNTEPVFDRDRAIYRVNQLNAEISRLRQLKVENNALKTWLGKQKTHTCQMTTWLVANSAIKQPYIRISLMALVCLLVNGITKRKNQSANRT
jgi:hypothetical protein